MPANVREESLDSVAEVDGKMEAEEEEASEESSSHTLEITCAEKKMEDIAKDGEDLGKETTNKSKSQISAKESTVECCVEEEIMPRESEITSVDEDRNGLCDKFSDSDIKILADVNEGKCPKEDILIKNDTVPNVSSIVICDEKVTVDHNAIEDFVQRSGGIQKRKRGRPRKPSVDKKLGTDKHESDGPHVMSSFSKSTLNNKLDSLAQSFSDDEIFSQKQHKLSRRHNEKLKPNTFGKGTSVNGFDKGLIKKQGCQASKISSDVSNKLGFEVGEICFEEDCGGSIGFGQGADEEEKEIVDMVVENMPLEVKAESGTEVQNVCNEAKSSSSNIMVVNGIEASSVLILPVES
jgi:hypothetical protein